MITLLEEARKIPIERRKKEYSREELDLAVALMNGDIAIKQAREVLNKKNTDTNYIYRLGLCIRNGISSGILKKIEYK